MKLPKLLLCFFAFLPFIQGQSQFAPVGASWTYQKAGFVPGSVEIETITVTGTNIIDGRIFQGLEGDFLCAGESVEYLFQDQWEVYRYANGMFNLLYDFDALPGESWTITNLPHEPSTLEVLVDSITQISINNELLNVQHISLLQGPTKNWCWGSQQILEGVGMLGMLFPEIGVCDPHVQALRCYEDILVDYNFANIPCDSTWTLLNNNDLTKTTNIHVFPNPVTDQINIKGIDLNNVDIQVFNFSGQQIQVEQKNTIFTNHWPNGIYYLKVINGTQVISTQKIVKYGS